MSFRDSRFAGLAPYPFSWVLSRRVYGFGAQKPGFLSRFGGKAFVETAGLLVNVGALRLEWCLA